MESSSFSSGLRVSGNMSADCTLLITDLFDLFPSSFNKLIPLLEERYRIVSITDSGFDNFNRKRLLRYETMQGFAKELTVLLHEKGIQNITFLAHSINAMLAFYAAIEDPRLFERIVLLSGVSHLKQNLAMQYQLHNGNEIDNDLVFKNVIQPQTDKEESTDQLHALLKQSFIRMNQDKAKLVFDIIMSTDCRRHLEKLTVPVMILQGVGDKIATSETAYFMHRHIPESYLVKINAKGHLPQLNAPEQIFRAMEIFIHPAVC